MRKDVTKQTYVKHYGVPQSRAKLNELVERAVSAVEFLGPAGDMLVKLARFVGKRSF